VHRAHCAPDWTRLDWPNRLTLVKVWEDENARLPLLPSLPDMRMEKIDEVQTKLAEHNFLSFFFSGMEVIVAYFY
jgi:hypothetical protein